MGFWWSIVQEANLEIWRTRTLAFPDYKRSAVGGALTIIWRGQVTYGKIIGPNRKKLRQTPIANTTEWNEKKRIRTSAYP